MCYVYQVHGLTLHSQFHLPELAVRDVTAGSPVDITVAEGPITVPDAVATAVPYLELAGAAAIFTFDKAGRFLVRAGRDVLVEAAAEADYALLRLHLFGSVMGMICHQRGLIGLHASAVAIDGRAAAFTGPSGAGKSTLAAHCLASGAQLVADDLLVLSVDQRHGVLAYPGMPNVKLWRDALSGLGHDDIGDLRPDWWRADKFHVPAADVRTPVQLTKLYVLGADPAAGDGEYEGLKGVAAAATLIANTFRVEYLDAAGRRDSHFRDCMRLASAIEVVSLRREDNPRHLPVTAGRIVEELRQR